MRKIATWLSVSVLLLGFSLDACGQTASALIRENQQLPGSDAMAIVTGISNTATNGFGGFAFTATTDGSIANVWGSFDGGPAGILATEIPIGDLSITGIESFFGISDTGNVCYGTTTENTKTGMTGLDGVFLDNMLILNEDQAIPTLPGFFSTFNSRPGISAAGEPYWVGGVTDEEGGSTQDRVLFKGTDLTPIIRGGDNISGVNLPLIMGSSIDFDVRFSACGSNYIMNSQVATGSPTDDNVLVSNGAALEVDGTIIQEGNLIPNSAGGFGDSYDNFDFLGIGESGIYMATGDTDADSASDEFVMIDGQIVLREGDAVGSVTLSGSIEGAFMNDDGDWAAIWDGDIGPANLELLIVNGAIVLMEGDTVDWNGDGVIDLNDQGAVIDDFNGISSLTMSRINTDGNVRVYFVADVLIDGKEVEGGFELVTTGNPIQLGDVNGSGTVDLLDVFPFVKAITESIYVPAGDINQDGVVDLLDVDPFIPFLTGG